MRVEFLGHADREGYPTHSVAKYWRETSLEPKSGDNRYRDVFPTGPEENLTERDTREELLRWNIPKAEGNIIDVTVVLAMSSPGARAIIALPL